MCTPDFQWHLFFKHKLFNFEFDVSLELTSIIREVGELHAVPILSVFPALIVHSELKSVHLGFPVAFIF